DVSVFLGAGNGLFQPAGNYGSGGLFPGDLAVADLNADGFADVVVADRTAKTVGVLLNAGDWSASPGGPPASNHPADFGAAVTAEQAAARRTAPRTEDSALLVPGGLGESGMEGTIAATTADSEPALSPGPARLPAVRFDSWGDAPFSDGGLV